MKFNVNIQVTIEAPDDFMAVALAMKFIAERAQFDTSADVDVPDDARIFVRCKEQVEVQ